MNGMVGLMGAEDAPEKKNENSDKTYN